MQNTAYNYNIQGQQQEKDNKQMKKASIEKLVPGFKEQKLNMNSDTNKMKASGQSQFSQQQLQMQQSIKIQNLNIIYNSNTYNQFQKKGALTKK